MNVFVFLFPGFSDWEIAYLTPEINKSHQNQLYTFTITGESVQSAGGLSIVPHLSLSEVDVNKLDILILPGGEAWEKHEIIGIDNLVKGVHQQQKIIAAICAATTYLAQSGYLDKIRHTSNDPEYLKHLAPAYNGTSHYIPELAVTDGKIITANGIAPIEFAKEIFKAIKLFDENQIEKWYQLFKNGIWSE